MRQLIVLTGFTVAALAVAINAHAQIGMDPPNKSSTTTVANPDAAAQETARPPSAGTPTTTGTTATTLPSAQSTLDSLLKDKPEGSSNQPQVPATPDDGSVTPSAPGVAPNQPKATRLREGEIIFNRTGRLAKDDRTQQTIFVFDGDGQGMSDPPITLLPSRLLAQMEDVAATSAQETKFKVSGEITEYRGKNYLLIQKMEAVRALNKGIGGR